MSGLQARGLAKRYGARRVFGPLDFDVASGTVVAVVGRNGAGKSSLLKIVAHLERATRGSIGWRDEKSSAVESEELRALCGLSAPDASWPRELTALENLEFVARVRGLDKSSSDLMAHLEDFGLRGRDASLTGDLSSGLRTRLSLALATLHAPPILLLDEPSANLDEAGRELVQRVLVQQRACGITLLATNDDREVEWCDVRIEL
jgi:heme exporter protein A